MGNIIFIGGIHGVGKGTLCEKLAQKIGIDHLSASVVLKWSEVKEDSTDKRVNDIPDTQNRLLSGLQKVTNAHNWYLIDGHYCLFDKENKVSRVPLETFEAIAPALLSVVIGDPNAVVERLAERDGQHYDLAKLQEMQRTEIRYAREVAAHLQVPLFEVRKNDTAELLNSINKIIDESTA